MASLPYDSFKDNEKIKMTEYNVQMVIYLIFRLMGQFVRAEVHSSKGRSDVEIETQDSIYIFEFKRNVSADEALQQIESKGYGDKYKGSGKEIHLIGVSIQDDVKNIKDWKIKKAE